MKLYEIPRESKILLPVNDGKGDVEVDIQMCTFRHLDGMYSVIETPNGDVVHLSASAPLKKVGNHYEFADEA